MDEKPENNFVVYDSQKSYLKELSGTGTQNDPFLISDANDLNSIRNKLSAYYKLTADIDLEGKEFTPVGTYEEPFTGTFDGDGHTISNLKIESTSHYTGLFGVANYARLKKLNIAEGKVTSSGIATGVLAGYLYSSYIEDVHLIDATVTGTSSTGALAGSAFGGCLTRCSSQGTPVITGTAGVGGLLANVVGAAQVQECCAKGTVTGASHVGGLFGQSAATVSNCFATGTVTATERSVYSGGLIGYAATTTINNCYAACRVNGQVSGLVYVNANEKDTKVTNSYFDSLLSGITVNNSYNRGKLTAALLRRVTFCGWAFGDIWGIQEGSVYPYLLNAGTPDLTDVDTGAVHGGAGTAADPYLIDSPDGLRCIRLDLAGAYRLTADIDLEGKEFTPVGTFEEPFTGIFDGDGHTISNLKIEGIGRSTGLFGYVRNTKLKNLNIKKSTVHSSDSYTGILAGSLYSSDVENVCLSDTVVAGASCTGALAGLFSGGSVIRCFSGGTVSVTGTTATGGLLGYAGQSVQVRECCASGTVTGTNHVGGLMGELTGLVSDCYAEGTVTSTENSVYSGGLAGYIASTTISNSYAACHVGEAGSGLVRIEGNDTGTIVVNSYFDSDIAGITVPAAYARTTEQMMNQNTYSGWDAISVWKYRENNTPALRSIEALRQDPFDLTFHHLTFYSVSVEWPEIPGAAEYIVAYLGKSEKSTDKEILIGDLSPDTDYEIRVQAVIGDTIKVWSKVLKIRTKKVTINGLHCSARDDSSVTMTWNALNDVEKYEVLYNGNIQSTAANTCTLSGLYADIPYVIRIRTVLSDGTTAMSSPVVEKIYTTDPRTDYAEEFIGKCGQQLWFLDEIEKVLNRRGKSVNTIRSQRDFATVYSIDLTGRGISGQIPAAIGELSQLKCLYLANNRLSGPLPEELSTLTLVDMDLSGNDFADIKAFD